ncbi:unnamed protein product [Linum trigynum]|uniref:Uncharacterized protein n=1 Tax=Linum trigynum TaxID=586398 RepID=A0AAV2GRI4_9ROSI
MTMTVRLQAASSGMLPTVSLVVGGGLLLPPPTGRVSWLTASWDGRGGEERTGGWREGKPLCWWRHGGGRVAGGGVEGRWRWETIQERGRGWAGGLDLGGWV